MGLCSLDISAEGDGEGECGESSGLETRSTWDPIPVVSPDGCVALGKELSLSGLLFAYPEIGAACEAQNKLAWR